MRLRDVLKDESGLLKETFMKYGYVKRKALPGMNETIVPFSVEGLLGGSNDDNRALVPGDTIHVFSKWSFRERPLVRIEGEVRCQPNQNRQPCGFELVEKMTVKDLVLMAGGLTEDASYSDFELYRTDPATKDIKLLRLDLSGAMEGPEAIFLQPDDRLIIHSIRELQPRQAVTISGEGGRAGQYPLARGMTK